MRQPIVVDAGGVIVVGHTRLLAAKRLGLDAGAGARRHRPHAAAGQGLSPGRQPHRRGDLAGISTCCRSRSASSPISATTSTLLGFDPDELAALLAAPAEGLTDADEVPEAPEEPVTQARRPLAARRPSPALRRCHRRRSVARLMDGGRASLMATDPPYLVDYDGGNHPQTWGNGGKPAGCEEKTRHWDAYTDHEQLRSTSTRASCRGARGGALTERPVLYQWFAMMRVEVVLAAWRADGLLAHQVLIWAKSRAGARPLRLHVRLRALPLRLGRAASARRGAAPAGRGPRRLGDRLHDRGWRAGSIRRSEAGRALPPADHLPHDCPAS